jgi:hypothetical protein
MPSLRLLDSSSRLPLTRWVETFRSLAVFSITDDSMISFSESAFASI